MKKPLLLIISIFFTILALIGCVKKMEKVTTILSGRVIEESQSMPLNNVNVVVTNGNQEYTNTHTGVTGTFKLDVTFDDLNDNYYLYLDDGNHNKRLDLKGVGKSSYDYKDIALYKDSGGGGGGSATTPTVTTTTPTNVTSNTATCGGNVTSDGGATIIQRGICYSTSQNPTTEDNVVTSGTGTGSFTCHITGLSINTKYYVRAYAINSYGTSYGSQKSFTTTSGGGGVNTPSVTTSSVSNVTTYSVTCGGNVTEDGGAIVTARGVCWNTSGNPTISNQHTTDGTGTGQFTSTITGLSANTTYYVKAYATNSAGTSYGTQKTFTTSGGGGSAVEEFSEGFESGMPSGWTILDANDDSWTWTLTSDIPSTWTYYATTLLDWYRTGSNAICSGSYINGVGSLTPNEYLITPLASIKNSSIFSFWAAACDAEYPEDHFGVAISTTTPTASAFTMLQEWTLTAKDGGYGGMASRNGNGAKTGTWYQYSVNLSAYAGQNVYIAIRHFNCNDQYIMCVDDVQLSKNGSGGQTYSYSFESNWENWTTIDADGDGYAWKRFYGSDGNIGHNNSIYTMGSQSYDNDNQLVLYPDNYLVSPQKYTITAGARISFYVCAQDANYAAEHYGVAISTVTSPNASSFTTIWEETLSAKTGKSEIIRGNREQGTWYLKTIDLNSYSGQTIWIAIRHFNCSDQFVLDIDDITIITGN